MRAAAAAPNTALSSRETNGDVGDASLVKRIFYSDDVTRKEGALAHALQKIDVTGACSTTSPACSIVTLLLPFSGKVFNTEREEVDDEVTTLRELALTLPIERCESLAIISTLDNSRMRFS